MVSIVEIYMTYLKQVIHKKDDKIMFLTGYKKGEYREMKLKEIIEPTKQFVIDILLVTGLLYLLKAFWDELEILFDGGIQESISDTVIAVIIIWFLWYKIRQWITIK